MARGGVSCSRTAAFAGGPEKMWGNRSELAHRSVYAERLPVFTVDAIALMVCRVRPTVVAQFESPADSVCDVVYGRRLRASLYRRSSDLLVYDNCLELPAGLIVDRFRNNVIFHIEDKPTAAGAGTIRLMKVLWDILNILYG